MPCSGPFIYQGGASDLDSSPHTQQSMLVVDAGVGGCMEGGIRRQELRKQSAAHRQK